MPVKRDFPCAPALIKELEIENGDLQKEKHLHIPPRRAPPVEPPVEPLWDDLVSHGRVIDVF